MRSDTSAAIICADKWILDSARATVLSRFLINLRAAADRSASSEQDPSRSLASESSRLSFRTPNIVGDMGRSLDYSPRQEDRDFIWDTEAVEVSATAEAAEIEHNTYAAY